MQQVIVNIVGLAGVGKSSVCDHLIERHDFSLYRPSDALREYAIRHNRTLTNRQDYIDCHAELIENDPLAIIQPVLDSKAPRLCMDGMRAPAPFVHLREKRGAILIFLDCPLEVRFARVRADATRKGHRAQPTIEAFEADEKPDYVNDNPNLPNMTEMRRLADHVIDANRPFDAVLKEVDSIVSDLLGLTSGKASPNYLPKH